MAKLGINRPWDRFERKFMPIESLRKKAEESGRRARPPPPGKSGSTSAR
jgi:hypothetical protein